VPACCATVLLVQVAVEQVIELPGNEQEGLVPSQEPAQGAVPPQELRGVVTLLHVPGVAEQD
jgi:hypothetical protein